MASQRFALQRKLAELPQFPVKEDTAERLATSIDRLNEEAGSGGLRTTLGPIIRTNKGPVKMELIVSNEGMEPLSPNIIKFLDQQTVGQMGQTGLEDALSNAQTIRDVSFNFIDPGGVPIFQYDPIQDPIARKQIQAVGGYKKPMMEALYRLIEEGGLRPGDIIKAAPIGLSGGDTRRATTYMGAGFGIPDRYTGEMYARILKGGGIEPIQLFSPNKQLASRVGAQQDMARLLTPKQLELDLNKEEVDVANFLDDLFNNTNPNMPF